MAQLHGKSPRGQRSLQPSAYLNVKISQQQFQFLNPTPGDVLVGNILHDSIGQNAKKKIAKRRIDIITGNVYSFSRSLNSAETLDLVVDTNKLASCLASISAAKDAAKDAAKNKREADARAKEAKKSQDKVELESKKVEVCEDFAEDIGKDVAHVCSLPVTKMKLLLKYYFEVPDALSKMRWEELQALVEDSFTAMEKDSDQHVEGEKKGEGDNAA